MKINDLLINSNSYIGCVVTVQGIFIFANSQGYIVDCVDNRENKRVSIKVEVDDLLRVLMKSVPPSAGTKYFYLDEAMVEGTFFRCDGGEFTYGISNVNSLVISKSGELFSAI